MGQMMSPRGTAGAQQNPDIEKGNASGARLEAQNAIYQLDSD